MVKNKKPTKNHTESVDNCEEDRAHETDDPRTSALHHSHFHSHWMPTKQQQLQLKKPSNHTAQQTMFYRNLEEEINPSETLCILPHDHSQINSDMMVMKKKKKQKQMIMKKKSTAQSHGVSAHHSEMVTTAQVIMKKERKSLQKMKMKEKKDTEMKNVEGGRGRKAGENGWKHGHGHSHSHTQVKKAVEKNTGMSRIDEEGEEEEESAEVDRGSGASNQWNHVSDDHSQVKKGLKKKKKKRKKKRRKKKDRERATMMINTDEEEEEDGDEDEDEGSVVGLLLSAFRRSGLMTCHLPSPSPSLSPPPVLDMEIGWPTDVQHVTHVTFDRFNGFLGLPAELQMEIPRRVPSASASVFGVSAESMQCSYDRHGNSVPIILLLLQERLYDQGGLEAEGIFRINPENSKEEHLRDQLNRGNVPTNIDVHCLAGLIKAWLRELPCGVLDSLPPEELLQCNTEEQCLALVQVLPPTQAALLDWVVDLMADVVQKEELNKMNARNVAMVFAPNMTQMSDPLTALMHAVQVMNFLKTLILKTLRDRESSTSNCKFSEKQDNGIETNKLAAKDKESNTIITVETHGPSKGSIGRKANIEKENHCPRGVLEEGLIRSFKGRTSIVDIVTDSNRLPLTNMDAIV